MLETVTYSAGSAGLVAGSEGAGRVSGTAVLWDVPSLDRGGYRDAGRVRGRDHHRAGRHRQVQVSLLLDQPNHDHLCALRAKALVLPFPRASWSSASKEHP